MVWNVGKVTTVNAARYVVVTDETGVRTTNRFSRCCFVVAAVPVHNLVLQSVRLLQQKQQVLACHLLPKQNILNLSYDAVDTVRCLDIPIPRG